MNLSTYLAADRGRQSALCKAIRVHAPDVSRWAKGERPIPLQHCASIEKTTGGAVRRWDLRPDDWHLIWPELIGLPGAPAVQPAPGAATEAEA
jgi:DNA-binding transcriptional regulator YdaS (Cro superfamily)